MHAVKSCKEFLENPAKFSFDESVDLHNLIFSSSNYNFIMENNRKKVKEIVQPKIEKKRYLPRMMGFFRDCPDMVYVGEIIQVFYNGMNDIPFMETLGIDLDGEDFVLNYRLGILEMYIRCNSNYFPQQVYQVANLMLDISENPIYSETVRLSYLDVIGRIRSRLTEEINNRYSAIFARYRRQNTNQKKKFTTVYNDSQNVHDSGINSSVIENAERLVDNLPPGYDYSITKFYIRIKRYIAKNQTETINKALTRIRNDVSTFGKGVTLQMVLVAVEYEIISNVEHKNDAYLRLMEELYEAERYCATGYLSRLVNSLSGYSNIVEIKITELEQLKNVVGTMIEKGVSADNDPDTDLYEEMIKVCHHNKFCDFICKLLNEKYDSLREEYGYQKEGEKFKKYMIEVISHYTGKNYIWKINQYIPDKISYELSDVGKNILNEAEIKGKIDAIVRLENPLDRPLENPEEPNEDYHEEYNENILRNLPNGE
jgi:hypothetical protein